MFELESLTTLKLINASPRKEHHGEDLVQAIDLSLRWETSNEALSLFDPWLRNSLYWNAAAENGQEKLEGVADVLPNLRSPKLRMPLGWEWEGVGYNLRVDHGLGGRSDLVLTGCKVGKFKFTVKEGGTVVIDFQVQANVDVNEKIVGKLCALEGTELSASLLAPNEVEPIDGSVGHPGLAAQKAAEAAEAAGQQRLDGDKPKSATDQFIEQHAPAGT